MSPQRRRRRKSQVNRHLVGLFWCLQQYGWTGLSLTPSEEMVGLFRCLRYHTGTYFSFQPFTPCFKVPVFSELLVLTPDGPQFFLESPHHPAKNSEGPLDKHCREFIPRFSLTVPLPNRNRASKGQGCENIHSALQEIRSMPHHTLKGPQNYFPVSSSTHHVSIMEGTLETCTGPSPSHQLYSSSGTRWASSSTSTKWNTCPVLKPYGLSCPGLHLVAQKDLLEFRKKGKQTNTQNLYL